MPQKSSFGIVKYDAYILFGASQPEFPRNG